jgi:predicted nucleotidyltransferase
MLTESEILSQIKKTVLDREPSAKIYLYGSRARGDAKPDSDWDLLILLNADKISDDLEIKITHPLYDLGFDLGEVISPMVYSTKEWASKHTITSFYDNVMTEGRMI